METLAPALTAYELERGKPMPSQNHSIVQLNLGFELKTRYRDRFRLMSEINIEVGGRVLVPDLGIFEQTPIDMTHDVLVLTRLPLTTIEILSPRQALDELIDKTTAYLEAGVKSCWIVLPKLQAVAVFSAPGTYVFFRGPEALHDAATGVELPLAPLFE